jgi:hypothetical protein
MLSIPDLDLRTNIMPGDDLKPCVSTEVPNRTIYTQNYGLHASNIVVSPLVLLVGQSPFLVDLYHFLGKFNSTPCCSI